MIGLLKISRCRGWSTMPARYPP